MFNRRIPIKTLKGRECLASKCFAFKWGFLAYIGYWIFSDKKKEKRRRKKGKLFLSH